MKKPMRNTPLYQDFRIAWQQSSQIGNPYPLVEFYNRNEEELRTKHNMSLDDLLGLKEQTLEKIAIGENTFSDVAPKESGNPLSELLSESPKKSERQFSSFAIILFATGIYLIFKSLKK